MCQFEWVTRSWRGGLPHALSRHGSAERIGGSRGKRMSRRPLDFGEHRRSLPARSAVPVPVAAFPRNADFPPGLRNSHEFRYSSDAKESRRPFRRASPLSPGAERSPPSCIRKNADCPSGLRNSHEFRYTSDLKASHSFSFYGFSSHLGRESRGDGLWERLSAMGFPYPNPAARTQFRAECVR